MLPSLVSSIGSNPARGASPAVPGAADDCADRVCIAWVDVSCLTRECMTHAVGTEQRLFILMPFASVYDLIRHCGRKPDLIVYHSHEADCVNLADIAALRDAFADTQLVVLSDALRLEPGVVKNVLLKGASGFILTSRTGLHMMVSALGLVASGGTFVPKEFLFNEPQPAVLADFRADSKSGSLTDRELEVLALVKQGKPNKLIAHALNMSPSTAKVHVRNLMRKMGASNRTQAAMNADKHLRPEVRSYQDRLIA
jgi:DNA-binding NarL/FixJ family response regulator